MQGMPCIPLPDIAGLPSSIVYRKSNGLLVAGMILRCFESIERQLPEKLLSNGCPDWYLDQL